MSFRSIRGRQILRRAYDKGIESGIALAGQLIRFERQRRYRKTAEVAVEMAADLAPRTLFVGRQLESLLRVTGEVVCDASGAIDRLNELVRLGGLAAKRADSLAGFIARGREGHVLDPIVHETTNVSVGRHIRQLVDQLAA